MCRVSCLQFGLIHWKVGLQYSKFSCLMGRQGNSSLEGFFISKFEWDARRTDIVDADKEVDVEVNELERKVGELERKLGKVI